MDRLFSLFGLYDVTGYLLSGLALLLGIYWVVAGELPALSTAAVFCLLAASYAAGQLAAIVGRGWEDRWWRRHGGKPSILMIEGEDSRFRDLQGASVSRQIEQEVGIAELPADIRFRLAHAKLRLADFHDRAETMRSLHGLCRNLAASSLLVGLAAFIGAIVDGDGARLWVVAAAATVIAPLFARRALRYHRRFAREVMLSFLALRMPEHRVGSAAGV